MEPITLILAALMAGASAGALDALKRCERERSSRLREAARPDQEAGRRPTAWRTGPGGVRAAPQKWEPLLTDELTQAGAAEDADLVAAAKALMELVDQAGAKSGKYNVTIKDSEGIQVGDGNFQVNKF